MGDLSSAYAVQEEAETKLMTVMRQRMGATDEEIQSIKDLASAQQQIGVIGDEVQLSGAQQIATFLKEKSSLETLMPAMNNLLAQQKGLNATTGDAVTVGNLMGKAMMGQVDALKRVGITFTEAEAQVMKYGTEQERAAMLAQIITNNVGNMNAALAQTDSGKLQQTKNWLGDIKEQIGALTTGFMPFISIAASTTTATLGIFKLCNGIGVLYAWLKNIIASTGKFVMALKKAYAALSLLGLNGKSTAAAVRIFNAALTSGAYSATAFKIALRGLLIASGIGLIIGGVTAIVEYFANKTDDATESVEKFDDATDNFTQAASQAKVQIDNDIKSLGELIKSHGDTTEAVQHLNETYGDTFGTFRTAEEWYDTLIKKSGLYAKQIGYEAQAKALATKVAEASLKKEMANDRIAELKKSGKDKVKVFGIGGSSITGYTQTTSKTVDSDEYKQALKDKAEAAADEVKYQKQLDKTAELAKKANEELKRGLGDVNSELKVSEMNIRQCEEAIEANNKAIKDTTDQAIIQQLKAQNAQLEARARLLDPDYKKNKSEQPQKQAAPAGSLAALNNDISTLRTKIEVAVDAGSRAKLYAELTKLEDEKRELEFDYKFPTPPKAADIVPSIAPQIETDVKKINPQLEDVSKGFAEMEGKAREAKKNMAGSFNDLGSSLSSLGSALGLPVLDVAGTIAQAVATMALGYAQASSKSSALGPWGWIAFTAAGLAQLAAVITSIKSMTAFANGGIVSGPTVGLIGEYAGASNNPEVVAPLDRLRNLLSPVESVGIGGNVTFKIEGRTLVGILARENKIRNRS